MKLGTSRAAARTRKHTTCREEAWISFPTTLGTVSLAWRGDAIHALRLGDPPEQATPAPSWIAALRTRVQRHLAGEREDFRDVPLDLSDLAPFQRQILVALRQVGPGTTVSYAELAELSGRPNAARAVGRAMALNPIPLLIPCHRVLRSDGSLGGYSAQGGQEIKRRLLTLEGVVV